MQERSLTVVNANDRLALASITLEVGTLAETVTATGVGAELQAQSAERS